jgi:hypothetical protein
MASCDSLHEAGSYIRTLKHWRQGWISAEQLAALTAPLRKSGQALCHRSDTHQHGAGLAAAP